MVDEKVITQRKADSFFAATIQDGSTATRAALNAMLPKTAGSTSTALAQYVQQSSTGSWPNPVRDANVAGRIYVASVDATRLPTSADGVRVGDCVWSAAGIRVATSVPPSGQATWQTLFTPGTSTSSGGTTTDPTTPTPTPVTPTVSDTSTPSATSRPFALIGTEGTWRTTGGTTLVQALSDQNLSGATADPSPNGGVSLTLDMGNFAHTAANTLNVTLWGASSTTAGNVTATIGFGGKTYAAAKTLQVGTVKGNLVFEWPTADQLSLPTSTWRDVEVTITRTNGGFTSLEDVTLQSLPPTVAPGPVDTSDPATIPWANGAVWYSQLAAAPLARASDAVRTYIRNQVGAGAIRLDCLPGGDAAPIWMVPGSAQRINIAGPVSSQRGDVALMTNAAGTGALQGVPIPANATPPGNLWKTAVIACLETKQAWELLGLTKTATGWSAEWGGRIDDTTRNTGAYPTNTGYTGSGLAWEAAAVKVSEAKKAAAGQSTAIQHAIGINLAYGTASSRFCWPATRSDGSSSDPGAPQMGQRLRLPASFNVDGSSLTPIGKAIAKAMQTYGAVIMGGAERISILCESGTVEQASTGVDPWGAILAGKTIDTVLAGLPLDQLEAVSPGWGGPAWVAETDTTTVTPVTPPPVTPTTPTTGNAAMRILGPSRSGLPWHSGVKADGAYATANVEKFGQWRGRPVDGGLTYPEYNSSKPPTDAEKGGKIALKNNGWCASLYNGFPGRIYYGMAPFSTYEYRADMNWDGRLWARLANGEMDDIIDAQADGLANNGRGNSIIRIAWEWNGDWYTWRAGLAGVEHFKAGVRRIVQRFRAKSSAFKFCFEINSATILFGDGPGLGALTKAYPGDDVIDLIGIDCYQFGGEGGGDGAFWRYQRQTTQYGGQGPRLDDVADFARSRGKGMAIMEWGIHGTSGYGDRPDFIEGMWNWLVKNQDVVACEAYFNEYGSYIQCSLYNSETGAIQNPQSAARYKQLWSQGV